MYLLFLFSLNLEYLTSYFLFTLLDLILVYILISKYHILVMNSLYYPLFLLN